METGRNNTKESLSTKKPVIQAKEKNIEPDSTINNTLILRNKLSSIDFFPKINKLDFKSSLRKCPVLMFCNKNLSEYLLAYQYEGGIKYAFDCFEIGYTHRAIAIEERCESRISTDIFKTESGLRLGISVKKLISIKGNNYQIKKDSIIVYRIDDYKNSKFLQRYNMPAYFLRCTIRNSKVIKIKFGFVYP